MKVTTLLVSVMLLLAATTLYAQSADRLTMEVFRGLEFRSIGPSLTTGRISDLEIDPNDPNVWYLTVGSSGLWKTVNRGNTWTPIFDEYPSYSLGTVVVDPRDSNVVWLGSGENTHNRSTSWGNGVYKSTDAGATWRQVGLADSQKIQRILIDPRDSDVVYVAAPGPLWNAGGDRGLFKTNDGGRTWERVLHVSDDTGITDAAFKPGEPDVIYAAAYQRRRRNAMTIAGGPEAGIFRSTDAGVSWERIENGLPEVEKGRIALGVDARNPDRVYTLVVARGDAGGFFLSENSGDSWTRMSDYSGGDPQYYGEIFVDPHRPDTVWNIESPIMRTTDKGATWERMPFDMHVDHHEIVFDEGDPQHMWIGNDGGLYETYDGGDTWRHFTNLPLSQFYRVSTDEKRPFYRVCGGAQDNGTICGPSRTLNSVGIRTSDWYRVGGGDGFQAYFDPYDAEIVYAQSQNGALNRLDMRSGQSVSIRPTGDRGDNQGGGRDDNQERGRWHWDSPLLVSVHAPGRIYYAGHRLYRSDDRGDNWVPVSDDLTRNLDRSELPIMGKVWDEDAVGLHLFTTTMSVITALDESPLVEGLLYTGSDDGLFHISEDGGENWTRLESIPGLPDRSYVTDAFASVRDADVVFATFNNWQNGDFRPWVMRSDDRGRTWVNITGDLPSRSGAWSVVQDHVDGDLLFVGTEFGVYFTVDGGVHWVELRGGIPKIQARDLHIQRRWNDLVVGTFGRGVYILDDYSALREVDEETLAGPARLFPLRPTPMFAELDQVRSVWGDQTQPNPPFGATLTYHLNETVAAQPDLVIMITDANGDHVRYLDLPDAAGVQRVTWNLRREPPAAPAGGGGDRGNRGGRGRQGALVETGPYTATIGVRGGDAFIGYGEPQTILVVPLQR
ncbi:MAG: glycosyl hydrolase [Acidobacteria bacterium]|nr:glycosyl hydrolase [Acidobacteriota bacterium]